MSEHLSKDLALVLAVLPEDDPERRAALAHTLSCAACARLLERGASMLSLIDAQDVEVEVDARLKARILKSVDRLEHERHSTGWEAHALALGSLLSIVLALLEKTGHTGLFPEHGLLCMAWQMLGAGLAFAGASVWARDWAPAQLALAAMGGALIGQLWLRVVCPTYDARQHLFAFHVSGVMVAALLGYSLARARSGAR